MIQFEIDYPHEHAGWMDCFLTFDGERRKLWASDVFPPFMPLVYLLKAIAIQRLPHKFYWDEEGKGAKFEAWPVAPDSPVFRLRVKHDRDERPWIEGEFDRVALVQAFLPVLREFAAHQQPTRGDWQIRPEDVADLETFLTRSIPPRTDFRIAQPLHFSFSRSEHFELPAQWLTWTTWDMPMLTWMLTDTDPFWQNWFALLEKIATGQPAEFTWENQASNEFTREMVELGELSLEELEPTWHMKVRAEPLPHPNHFRLTITDTDSWYKDFPLLDEVLDRRQVVQAFCETFEQFLEKDYQVFAEEDGRVFDLRTLPLDRIKTLLAKKDQLKMTTTFRNIPLTRANILAALRDFDTQYPNTNDYDNWLDKANYTYALLYDGKRYPPKYILSVVTGIPLTDLHGGDPANRVFRELGFDIEDK